ncbi:MAG TPA: MarR family transcriptional regulator [Solirubrobacterales bacterium]|jgi:DNA-binding MarR family transcriptional regulator|nr:MarR family transcriptional regulator [Solirubrobacterales bacterium]
MSAASPEGRDAALAGLREEFGALLGAERRLRSRDSHRKEPGGLTYAQVRALFVLGDHEESTAGEIAEQARLSPGAVSGMLDELEEQGIVSRVRCADDRRRVLVTLTDAGRKVLGERKRRWAKRWEDSMDGVDDHDLEAAVEVMRRISAALDEV